MQIVDLIQNWGKYAGTGEEANGDNVRRQVRGPWCTEGALAYAREIMEMCVLQHVHNGDVCARAGWHCRQQEPAVWDPQGAAAQGRRH